MGRSQVVEQALDDEAPGTRGSVGGARRIPWIVGMLPAVAALAVWAIALGDVDLSQVSGFGLLAAVPPTYFAAFLLLSGGFAWQATRSAPESWMLAMYVIALVVMVHATTPILYDEPRYVWTYKHFGPIDYVATFGGVERGIDLYHNWPAFFALNAWLSRVTGTPPIGYAEWSQLFFELANVAAVVFAVRGLTRSPRLVWVTAWFFLVANWIGQDYLAPQASGFLLSVVVIGVCLRCVPSRWMQDAFDPPLRPAGALVVGGLAYLAVVVTHQFSPLLLIASVAALALAGQRVPLRAMLGMILVEVWWLVLAWPELSERTNLFEPDPTRTPTPQGNPDWALAGSELVRYAQVAVVVLMIALAALGLARRMRMGQRDYRPVALMVAPVVVGLVQTYGGESLLRAFLFGLPWLSFLAAVGCVPTAGAGERSSRPAAVGVLAATIAVGGCFMIAFFGRELENHVVAADIAASRWIEARPPGDRSTVRAGPQLPNRLTAVYPTNAPPPVRILSSRLSFWDQRFDQEGMARLADELRTLPGRNVYLIVTPSQEANASLYGLAPPGGFERLTRALLASSDFTLVHRRGRGFIFSVQRPPEPPPTSG